MTPNDRAAAPSAGPSPATTAARIHADRTAGTLTLEWRDGHRTDYEARELRLLCPCAFCRGEAGLPGWLDTSPTLTAEQVRLVDVQLVGSYALAPSWGDGHHTGYYTFAMLREHCPCATCSARRAGAAATPPRTGHADHGETG